MSFRSMLNRKFSLYAPARVADGLGGFHTTQGCVVSDRACSLNPVGAREADIYKRLGVEIDHVLWCEPIQGLGIPKEAEEHEVVMDDGERYDVRGKRDIGGRFRIWELALKAVV